MSLPKLYGVSIDECLFETNESHGLNWPNNTPLLIILRPRRNGDYEHHLQILKAQRLIRGPIKTV